MSGPFGDLGIPASGMSTYKTWLDAISDNIANANTVRPTSGPAFQARYLVAAAKDYGSGVGNGVQAAAVTFGDPNGRVVYEPNNPLADKDGNVRYPDVDLAEQMTQMITAQRAYQLNVSAFERVRDAYLQSLDIGR